MSRAEDKQIIAEAKQTPNWHEYKEWFENYFKSPADKYFSASLWAAFHAGIEAAQRRMLEAT